MTLPGHLFITGTLVIFLGFALIAVGAASQGNVSAGGFVLIGPFPIVFGTGASAGTLASLSIVLGVLMLLLFYFGRRRAERTAQNVLVTK